MLLVKSDDSVLLVKLSRLVSEIFGKSFVCVVLIFVLVVWSLYLVCMILGWCSRMLLLSLVGRVVMVGSVCLIDVGSNVVLIGVLISSCSVLMFCVSVVFCVVRLFCVVYRICCVWWRLVCGVMLFFRCVLVSVMLCCELVMVFCVILSRFWFEV